MTVKRQTAGKMKQQEERLGAIAEQFMQAAVGGAVPDIEAVIRDNPDLESAIRDILPALAFAAEAGIESRGRDGMGRDGVGDHSNGDDSSGSSIARLKEYGAVGDFQIVREIGRGGMGVVYEAEQLSLNRHVALKVLPFAAMLDQRALQRFKNEVAAAAQLSHPNIVDVYAVGCERGVHHYAMRLVHGQTLAFVIEQLKAIRDKNLPVPDSISAIATASTIIVRAPHAPLDNKDGNGRGDNSRVGDHLSAASPASGSGSDALTEDVAHRESSSHAFEIRDSQQETAKRKLLVDAQPRAADSAEERGNEQRGAENADTVRNEARDVDTVRSRRQRPSAIHYRSVAEFGATIAEALDHAHQQGVVHRDIKPSNLMLDADGKPWVTDFGLAQVETGANVTMTGDILGTARYMSPEQVLAKRVVLDHRTDIYSLGVTLYELLTLQTPFEAEDRQELFRKVAFEEPKSPRAIDRAIPHDLETIILKCLEKNPSDRYATAQDLADDLERFLESKPIVAKRAGLASRAKKWAKRHSGSVVLTSIFLLVLSVSLGATSLAVWDAKVDAEDARDHAEDAMNEAVHAQLELERILEFMVGNLQSPDPLLDGRAVTIAEALPRATAQLDEDESLDASTRGKFYLAIGRTYRGLGLPREARTALERSRTLLAEADVAESVLTELDYHSALTARDLGETDQAIEALGRVLEQRGAALGATDRVTLRTASELGRAHALNENFAAARRVLTQTLQSQQDQFGEDDMDAIETLNALAGVDLAEDDVDGAIRRHNQALTAAHESLGENHLLTLAIRQDLAYAYRFTPERDQATDMLRDVLAERKKLLGEKHPEAIATTIELAKTLPVRPSMRFDAAEVNPVQEEASLLLRSALERCETELGENHPLTLRALSSYANLCVSIGQQELGVRYGEEALRRLQKRYGDNDPATISAMQQYARALQSAGLKEEALDVRKRVLDLAEAAFGPDDEKTIIAIRDIGILYRVLEDYDSATIAYENTAAKYEKTLGPDDEKTIGAMRSLANSYYLGGNYERRVEVLEEALKRWGERPPADAWLHVSLKTTLAAAYGSIQEDQKSRALYQDAVAMGRAIRGENNTTVQNSISSLADRLRSEGKLDEAIAILKDHYGRLLEEVGPGTLPVFLAVERITSLQIQNGDLESAAATWRNYLDLSLAKLGHANEDVGNAVLFLSNVYSRGGETDRAIALLEEHTRLVVDEVGELHPETLRVRFRLANGFRRNKEFQRAQQIFAEILPRQEQVLGAMHPDTLRTIENLAGLCEDVGDTALAVRHYERLHNYHLQGVVDYNSLGGIHRMLERLSWLYETDGQLTKAIRVREDSIAIEDNVRANSRMMAPRYSPAHLGYFELRYRLEGATDQLIRDLEEYLGEAGTVGRRDANPWALAQTCALLATSHLELGHYAAARAAAEDCVGWVARQIRPQYTSRRGLGNFLIGISWIKQGNENNAQKPLAAGIAELQEIDLARYPGVQSPYLEGLQYLANRAEREGDQQSAKKWRTLITKARGPLVAPPENQP